MKHLMLDLETLSTKNNAVILSIGAQFFDPINEQVGADFYTNIDLNDSIAKGFEVDGDTVYWWLEQEKAARYSLLESTVGVDEALEQFTMWFKNMGNSNTRVWGNGATFDNVILTNAFSKRGVKRPWHYSKDRDIRTVHEFAKSQDNGRTYVPVSSVAHNALADVQKQINWFIPMYRQAKGLAPCQADQ